MIDQDIYVIVVGIMIGKLEWRKAYKEYGIGIQTYNELENLIKEKMYKISKDRPPNWDELEKVFKADWERTAVAYHDTIHVKYPDKLPPDILVHEQVHLKQQGGTIEKTKEWWKKYIENDKHRYSQELEAYRKQYQYIREVKKDRNQIAREAHLIATKLSSSLYGNIVTYSEALKEIKK